MFIVNIKEALETSNKCLFFLSDTLLCCGLSTQELRCKIPCCDKYSPRMELKYSLPLSVLSIRICEIGSGPFYEKFGICEQFRIYPKEKNPSDSRVIIDKYQKSFFSIRGGDFGKSPYVIMNLRE